MRGIAARQKDSKPNTQCQTGQESKPPPLLRFGVCIASQDKPVAYPGLGQNIFWPRRLRLDFLSELIHRHPQILRLVAVIRPPNRLQQTAVRKRLALMSPKMP